MSGDTKGALPSNVSENESTGIDGVSSAPANPDPKPQIQQVAEQGDIDAVRKAYEPLQGSMSGVQEGAGPSSEQLGTVQQPKGHKHRTTPPARPNEQMSSGSHDAAARIQGAVAQAHSNRGDRHGAGAARNVVQSINVQNLHPAIASYKAEALDYLDGEDKRRAAAAGETDDE